VLLPSKRVTAKDRSYSTFSKKRLKEVFYRIAPTRTWSEPHTSPDPQASDLSTTPVVTTAENSAGYAESTSRLFETGHIQLPAAADYSALPANA